MVVKGRVNQVLQRFGVGLVRAETLSRYHELNEAEEQAQRRTARRARRAAAEQKRPAARRQRQRLALPADMQDGFEQIWPQVLDRTMTSSSKAYHLHHATKYVVAHDIPGDIVECGVWRGGSMLTVALTLLTLGVTDRDLHLFDTFTGMSEPTDRDVGVASRKLASDMLKDSGRRSKLWAEASLEDVRVGFEEIDYPSERVHFVPGLVEETIPDRAPEQISLLRLDTDWYESTKHELEHLYSRLSPGGVLIIDDYGSWRGSKDATDEFLAATHEPLLLSRIGQGRAAVKPRLAGRLG